MPDEDRLIRRITRAIPSFAGAEGAKSGALLGIADDAALIKPPRAQLWVVTVDAFIEGVHFWGDKHPPESVGYKALARATSDIAAMGAVPRFFLLTLALPKSRTGVWLDRMLRGMGKAARSLGLTLVGGDTTQSPSVSMSITVIGESAGEIVTRAGAKPGDLIYVSGPLGCAQLGLELVRRGLARDRRWHTLLEAHLHPRIRTKLGLWLAQHNVASAMMDISDGLSSDLSRLCAASGVGARICVDRIPRDQIPMELAKRLRRRSGDTLDLALHGGDDYELLFTVPKQRSERLKAAPGSSDLRAIGEIRSGRRISLVSAGGQAQELKPSGWDSFRR
ncbi:MAG TPA: thiamine-phosphate kinase [Candidatus Acidoferrales bacterium]